MRAQLESHNSSRYHVQLPALPKSWSYERFDKILDVQGGSQPPKSTFVYEPTPGYVQLLQIRDFGERGVPTFVREDSVTKSCTEDDILIARYGASLGRIVTGEKGAYNVALAKVIFDKEQFFNRYLFYLLQTPYFQTPIHMISRSAQNGFNKGDLSDIILPVAPLSEQHQIVEEIEKQFTRLEAGVGALQRVQANLKRYRAAVLKAACSGELVPTEAALARGQNSKDGGQPGFETGAELLERILEGRRKNWSGRGKYKEPSAPDTANLPPLPEGWTWASLEQLLELMRNGISAKPDAESGLPILRISAVRALSVNLNEVRYLNAKESDYLNYALTEGDLLFTRYNGNPTLVGVCGVVPALTSPFVHPDKLIRCKLVPNGALSDFVAIMANIGASRDYLAKRVRTTAGQAGISGGDLKGLPVPLPPLAEQERIVAEVERRLSVVEELEVVVSVNLQRAGRLRLSILQKAFSGELIRHDAACPSTRQAIAGEV